MCLTCVGSQLSMSSSSASSFSGPLQLWDTQHSPFIVVTINFYLYDFSD
uniref:Uncharacterized protein n=1 Tax=Scleropages formosus TaxID=113540 RepID=A0A8C9RXM8_SCLFO